MNKFEQQNPQEKNAKELEARLTQIAQEFKDLSLIDTEELETNIAHLKFGLMKINERIAFLEGNQNSSKLTVEDEPDREKISDEEKLIQTELDELHKEEVELLQQIEEIEKTLRKTTTDYINELSDERSKIKEELKK